jgi:hypothetical protein
MYGPIIVKTDSRVRRALPGLRVDDVMVILFDPKRLEGSLLWILRGRGG